MKNILFGLIATVLFSFTGHSETQDQIDLNTRSYAFSNECINPEGETLGMGCVDLTIGYGYGGFYIEATARFCCWRTAAQSPHFDCGFVSNRPGSPIVAYLDVETLDSKILNKINEGGSNKITLSKSQVGESEGKFYKVLSGDYTIEKDQYGRFIKVNIVEVLK